MSDNRRVFSVTFLVLAATLAVPSFITAQVATPSRARIAESTFAGPLARFEEQLKLDVEQDGVGAVTAAVMIGDSLVWARAFGWVDREAERAAEIETIYRTGSISKTFTAVLFMRLVERGTVGLDDPVVTYLPEFELLDGPPEEVRSITLRQLASHTGGLIREPGLEHAAAGPIDRWESKVLQSIPITSLQSTPGAEYSYSNIGFGILGLALSRAANRPFMELVREFVFDPLEMRSSTFVVPPGLESRLAVGYANRPDGSVNAELPALEHSGRGYKVPNGGVYSMVEDLGQFMAGLSGSSATELLSADSRREMLAVQTPESPSRGYGLGLSLRTTETGIWLAGHGGSVAGYNAYMVFDPDSKIGVVLLRNYNRGETNLGRAASGLLEELARGVRGAGGGEL
jgi:CubicO group peptidase (beta-lactamase class C family)